MNMSKFPSMLVVLLGVGALLLLQNDVARDQTPASPPGAPKQVQERDALANQVDGLRQAGRFDQAVTVAERLLTLQRQRGSGTTAGVADALSRLAELAELRGDWSGATARRKEALAVRERVDGKEHWRTFDARLALTFAEKIAGLAEPERTKITATLRKEQEAGRLSAQGKYAEAERMALEVLETYRARLGAEGPEVARVWHVIGRDNLARKQWREAKEASERALAIWRKALPRDHPDLARSLNNLGAAENFLGNHRRALELLSEAVQIKRKSLGPGDIQTAMSLANLGLLQFAMREYAAAKASHEEVLAIFRKALPKNHIYIADCLNNLGNVQSALQNYAAAKAIHEEALAIGRNGLPQDVLCIARCLNDLGNVQIALHDYAAAKVSHEEALAIRRKARFGYHADVAQSLNGLGVVQQKLRDFAAAKVSYQEALAIYRKVRPKDHADTAGSLNNLGSVQRDLGEFAAAKANDELALAMFRKVLPKDDPKIATSLDHLGEVQQAIRQYAAAKLSFEEALAIRRKAFSKDHPEIADSLIRLGKVLHELREYAAAKASREEALTMRRSALPKDHPDVARSLNLVGDVQFHLREYADAKTSLEQALAIFRKALRKDDPDIARCLINLGNVQDELGEFTTAKASREEAVAILRKVLPKDDPEIAIGLNNLGTVQRALRDYRAARASHAEALAIRRKALPKDDPQIADSLNNLGTVQSDMHEYRAARASHEEALAIYRKALPEDDPRIALSLNNLGAVHYELREYAAGTANAEEALAIYRKVLPRDDPLIASSLLNLGRLRLASRAGAASALPAIAEATDILHADQLHLAVAQAEPEQLAAASTSHWALSLLLIAARNSKADPRPAYDRVVRVKGSVTAQQRWVRQARDAADRETTRLLGRLRQLTQQIVGLSVGEHPSDDPSGEDDAPALLRALCDERARLERLLTTRSAAFRAVLGRARVGFDEVRAALPEGTALVDLVDYVHGGASVGDNKESTDEHAILAFVMRPDRRELVLVSLGSSQALADLIDGWRASFGAGKSSAAGTADAGVELRRRLWEPLEEHLRGLKVVLVSPDGPLNGLPWAALPGAKKGSFLIHEYAFAVVPVPQLLPEILRRESRPPAEKPSLLLAGGIDYGAEKERDAKAGAGKLPAVPFFGPLPGAESEVNDLRAQFEDAFPDSPAPQRLGKDKATKEAILAATPAHRFVHLATHGFFADEAEQSAVEVAERADLLRGRMHIRAEATGRHPGLLSGLVFAGVNRPDRPPEQTILTALEAADLNLDKVELVTLSACDTGRGRVAGGEGVLGLQRAFQLAGARSVVASLWKVPDEETHQLMREFYRQVWSKDPVSKAEALRKAQIWMLENWKRRGTLERQAPQAPPSPYYWAAFVLSGDWR
jgi:CHAT domain-containing protein